MSASDRRLVVGPEYVDADSLRQAADWLRAGGLVVYPTDTYYGIAADPASSAAVRAVFDVKGRASGEALPLVAASLEQVRAACGELSIRSAELAEVFWPGPLSLVLDAPSWMVPEVHAGRGTIAIRVPNHPVARALAEAFGRPITATSANRSGRPPVARVDELGDLLDDPRLFVIDAGPTPGGAPSTLVDARRDPPACLRHGAIPWNRVLTSRRE
ncbi:MAG: L-threonylcarbamoyladenylate synthase [Acidobacteriota bacterium]